MPSGTGTGERWDGRIGGIVQSGDKTRDDRAAEEEEERDLSLAQPDTHKHTCVCIYVEELSLSP